MSAFGPGSQYPMFGGDPAPVPQWSPVDEGTGNLLDLLADDGSVSTDHEWHLFLGSLRTAAACGFDNKIDPNFLRRVIDGAIKPQRIGAFTHRALAQGLVEYTGRYVISTDTKGRNGGKPCRELRWIGGRR